MTFIFQKISRLTENGYPAITFRYKIFKFLTDKGFKVLGNKLAT